MRPHVSKKSLDELKSFFDDRLISDGRWPPRPPDMSSLDFFLWGYLKDRVYANKPETVDALKQNITQEINTISISLLQRVSRNVEKRIWVCLLANSGQFEHLL